MNPSVSFFSTLDLNQIPVVVATIIIPIMSLIIGLKLMGVLIQNSRLKKIVQFIPFFLADTGQNLIVSQQPAIHSYSTIIGTLSRDIMFREKQN